MHKGVKEKERQGERERTKYESFGVSCGKKKLGSKTGKERIVRDVGAREREREGAPGFKELRGKKGGRN